MTLECRRSRQGGNCGAEEGGHVINDKRMQAVVLCDKGGSLIMISDCTLLSCGGWKFNNDINM